MQFKILHQTEINRTLWDALVIQSPKSSIFQFSWYLDLVDDDWQACVENTYQWVMPFFSDKKQIINQPSVPYLGLISKIDISKSEFQTILSYLNQKYTSINYSLSKFHFKYSNLVEFKNETYYQKDFISDYIDLKKIDQSKVIDAIKFAECHKLKCVTQRSLFQFIEFFKTQYSIESDEMDIMRKIILKATQMQMGKMYAVYNKTNELIGEVFILYFKTKIYTMYSAFDKSAYSLKADFYLFHTLIEDLTRYNVTIENHSKGFRNEMLSMFGFKSYYSFTYMFNAKQNFLSLLLQYLKL